jgi:recombination protein RecA
MALPAEIAGLELPRGVFRGAGESAERTLPFGLAELDAVLPGGGLARGQVIEIAVGGGAALATTLALSACRSVQQEAERAGGEPPWCAFVDPSRSLFAPGVAATGVRLDRLLVIRPPLEALARAALRVVESRAFAVVVIDALGVPGKELDVALGSWPRVIRRLAMAAEGQTGAVLLLTDRDARRPLPLPVAQRIELSRPSELELEVRIAKDRRGRVSSPKTIRWTRGLGGGDHARLVG